MNPEILRKQLERLPTDKKMTESKAVICCPFHQESTPSCTVNLDPGLYHKGHKVSLGYWFCFGCRAKGPWNELAEKTGLQKFGGNTKPTEQDMEVWGRKIKSRVYTEITTEQLLKDLSCVIYKPIVEGTEWRGFKYNFLKHLGAWSALCADSGSKCLVFPVYSSDMELIGGFKAWFSKTKGSPSYINASGQWVRDEALWPLHMLKPAEPGDELKTVWLTEGQRDALRLVQLGIPAVCIMGTNNITAAKLEILQALGYENVVLMMDGDKAGVKATNDIRRLIKDSRLTLHTQICKLKRDADELGVDKIDPFDLPIDRIKHYYRKYGNGERIARPWSKS